MCYLMNMEHQYNTRRPTLRDRKQLIAPMVISITSCLGKEFVVSEPRSVSNKNRARMQPTFVLTVKNHLIIECRNQNRTKKVKNNDLPQNTHTHCQPVVLYFSLLLSQQTLNLLILTLVIFIPSVVWKDPFRTTTPL